MAYTIKTKDGIEIFDIPDELPPDDPSVKKAVADARATLSRPMTYEHRERGEARPMSAFEMAQQKHQILDPDVAAPIAGGIVTEPLVGLTGLISLPFFGAEGAEEIMGGTRKSVMSPFTPETPGGQAKLQAFGEKMQPLGQALEAPGDIMGETVFDVTGSPTLATAANMIPAVLAEAMGFKMGRTAAQIKTGLPSPPKKVPAPNAAKPRAINKALLESAPEVEQIKDVSRGIYREIDELDVTANPEVVNALANKLEAKAKAANVDAVLTPDSARALELIKQRALDPSPKKISDFDTLRQIAQQSAQAPKPADARIGAIMVDEIDNFLDNLNPKAFKGPDVKTVSQIGERYKAARNLWGRARRAEIIQEVFEKSRRQGSGFENGLRSQFRQILNNKKRSRYFTADELRAMDDLVQGTNAANMYKLVGRLGVSEGAATNILGGMGSFALFGPLGTAVGQASRKLSQKVTEAAAQRIDTLIRGGAKGQEIVEAYLKSVPPKQRNIMELSDLLMESGKPIDDLLDSTNKMIRESAEVTKARRTFESAESAGAMAPLAAPQGEE